MNTKPDVWVFGCIGRAGHSLHGKHTRLTDNSTPWGYDIDGGIAPLGAEHRQTLGLCFFAQKGGWSAIDFYDRSGDSRLTG